MDIVAEYQYAFSRTKLIGKKVKFTISGKPNQSPARFFSAAIKQITNMLKFSKIHAENVGSVLQNDGSTDIMDSSNNALAKSEIEVTRSSTCSSYVRIMLVVWLVLVVWHR